MESITRDDVVDAITHRLDGFLQVKLEPELKQLEKAEPGSDQAQKIEKAITKLRERFSRPVWLENAAKKDAKQLRFGTHISKGIHPDSKGDNINFRPMTSLPAGIVGSQQLAAPELDANGNAAALPLAAFLNTDIKGAKLRDLILADHPALNGVFADDQALSRQYQQAFQKALAGETESPATHERNKQLLWPMEDAIERDNYHCLVPLHPSALVYEVSQKINSQRFSEENKEARDNRKKKNFEQKAYVSIVSLATTQLGGTKPQNISLLTSKQRGRNLLLESYPPTYIQQHDFSLSKRQENFFNKNLAYHCREGLQALYGVIEAPKNVMAVRDQRKQALGMIIGQALQLAESIQRHYAPGWSEGYQLKMAHKYWLDPHRAGLPGQDTFAQGHSTTDWVHTVMEDFSAWLNNLLRDQFKQQATDFDDTEYREWLREMESAIKASQRAKEGIF